MAVVDSYVQTAASWFQYQLLQGDDPISLMSFAQSHFPGFSQETLQAALDLAITGIQTAVNLAGLDATEPISAASPEQPPPTGMTDVRILVTFIDEHGNLMYKTYYIEESWDASQIQVNIDAAIFAADEGGRYGWEISHLDIVPSLFTERAVHVF